MRILIRADASVDIGSGHVMRCAALADVLRARGAEVAFLCRELPESLRDSLIARGNAVVKLAQTVPFNADDDARACIAAVKDFGRPDWLLVDHYGLDARWESAMNESVGRIMVIDDLANRPHDCQLLLDQNHYRAGGGRYLGLVPAACRLLIGPRYALLRQQFCAAAASRRRRDGRVRRLLICFGGSDPANLTARAIDAFLAARLSGQQADVVAGGANPHWEALSARYGALADIRLHRNVADMATLMGQADLYLGAGGSMTWERSALGLPGLTIAVAANQEQLCEDLESLGGGLHLGDPVAASAERIGQALSLLAAHPGMVRACGERIAALVDGRGSARAARLLIPPVISFRPATADDCDLLHAWRNAPETRRHSGNGEPIPLAAHRAWFAASLENPKRILLVGEQAPPGGDSVPVGVLRYDLDADSAVVSVYLVPGLTGAGLGSALIEAGDAWLKQHFPVIGWVHARVSPENLASIGAFGAAGYVAESSLFIKNLYNPCQSSN